MPTTKFSITPVRGVHDIMRMRLVRNQVASYMTNNPNQIGRLRQLVWYFTGYQQDFSGYLVRKSGEVVGYGLIRYKDGKTWVSGGLVEGLRGRGYGQQLFGFLTEEAMTVWDREVWLDVLNNNTKAKNLYTKLGYQIKSQDGRVTVMRYVGGEA